MIHLSKVIILSALLLWLGMIHPVSAQSSCGDLSVDDCDLLQTAQITTSNLSSATFQAIIETSLGFEFLGNLFELRMVADGAYSRVSVDSRDIEADYLPFYELNADMSLFIDITFSEFLLPDDDTVTTTSLNLRYVDGMGYADLTKILPFVSPILNRDSWYRIDVPEYIRRLMRDLILPSDFLSSGNIAFALDYWGSLADVGSSVTRLEDEQRDDQTFAVFENVLVFGTLFDENPFEEQLFINLFTEFLEAEYGGIYDDKELRQSAVFYADLFRSAEIRLMQMVGLDDGYVHQTYFTLNFAPNSDDILNPDPLGLSMFSGAELYFSIDFRYTQFEDVPLTTAPEDSTPVRYEDIFGSGDTSPF